MRLKDIQMKKKLIGLFLFVGLLPLIIVGWRASLLSERELVKKARNELIAVREIKKNQILEYLKEHEADLSVLTTTVERFRDGAFEKLETVQELKKAHMESFLEKIQTDVQSLSESEDVRVIYEKLKEYHDTVGTGPEAPFNTSTEEYRLIYERYGDNLPAYIKTRGYHDIFLICASHGHVMFSADQGVDLGTNLVYGPYKDDGLARIWKKVLDTGEIMFDDFSPYSPHDGEPALFIGAPVFADSESSITGVVVLQIPKEPINAIMHRRQGMGKTGETYLIGKSGGELGFRSDMLTMGGGEYVVGYRIDNASTSYINSALSGEKGQAVYTDSTGRLVIVSYDPLQVRNLDWACISKINLEEAIVKHLEDDAESYFTRYVEKYGYHDLYMVHPEGDVFYSVKKEEDYRTNLKSGPFADSGLGRLYLKVLKSKNPEFEDFSRYQPGGNKPYGFIGTPIIGDNAVQLIVALQFDESDINEIMQEREGMGKTGETYLVGPDMRMRSDSYLDPENHSVEASFEGTVEENGIDTEFVDFALSGQTSEGEHLDYRGKETLSAYAPVHYGNLEWALMAEVDKAEIMEPVNSLIFRIAVIGIILSLLIVGIAFYIGKTISDPLIKGVDFATLVAEGDLTTRIDVHQQDELGVLAAALNKMSASLKDIINDLSSTSETISASAEELSSVAAQSSSSAAEMNAQADTVAAAVEEVSSSVSTVASAAEQSSASVTNISSMTEEMASTIKNMRASVRQTADEAREAADASKDISDRIHDIASSLEETTASFNEVARNTSKASKVSHDASRRAEVVNQRMETLVKASKQIGKIVGVIKDIADQTNMLALNATIEAAGAGEAGKGFAVVAGEVKELAKQSADATDEIAGQIEDIQNSTNDVVVIIREISGVIDEIASINETIASSVEEQNATSTEISKNVAYNAEAARAIVIKSNDSSDRMRDTEQSMNEIVNTAVEVARNVDELSQGVKDVAKAASEAARGVTEISKNIQNITVASKDSATGASQTESSSGDLARLATKLTEIVTRFKI